MIKTCYSAGPNSGMRRFRTDDVVLLDGVRCSGTDHDGCQKACMIFWREAWLRRVEPGAIEPEQQTRDSEKCRTRLRTVTAPNQYFCQASELLKVTETLLRRDRLKMCFDEVRSGNCTAVEMAQRLARWVFWRTRRLLLGEYARGKCKSTPLDGLNLQPNEKIEVKSMEAIRRTLNGAAHNRGLYFSPDMSTVCGTRQEVKQRAEKIIVDGTGEMRKLRNTAFLEDSLCGCVNALGGCSRCEFAYWREIWLRRIEGPR